MLWWRVQLNLIESNAEETEPEDVETNQMAPSTTGCEFEPDIPKEIELGIGELSVESLAVMESIEWLDLEEVDGNSQRQLFSSFVSINNSSEVWVFGVAVGDFTNDNELSLEEFLSQDQNWFLRPAYVFPF